jgi:uncharacterized LabA/DUF88 family protein
MKVLPLGMDGQLSFNYMQEPKKQFSFYLYDKPTLVIIDWFSLYNRYKDIDLELFFNYLRQYKDIYQIRFYQGTIQDKNWSVELIKKARSIGYEVVTKDSKYIKIEIKNEKHLQSVMGTLQELLDNISEKNSSIANKIYTIKEQIKSKITNNETDDVFVFIDEIDQDLKKLNININTFKNQLERPIRKPKCDFDAEIAKDIILDIDKFSNLILFSRDGDFASTMAFLVSERSKRVFVMYPQGSFGEIDYRNFNLIKILDDKRREYIKGFTCRPVDHILEHLIKKEPADKSAGPDIHNVVDFALEVNI